MDSSLLRNKTLELGQRWSVPQIFRGHLIPFHGFSPALKSLRISPILFLGLVFPDLAITEKVLQVQE